MWQYAYYFFYCFLVDYSVGLWFDVRFGFGLLNAGAIVSAALNWTTVPDKCVCRVDASS